MGALLESIHTPADLKRLSFAQMAELAEQIRAFLIQTLAKTGGHLGPNLGVVELTLALHAVFNTPEDKLLFDVSHQAYIHKLLTGRRSRFRTKSQRAKLGSIITLCPPSCTKKLECPMKVTPISPFETRRGMCVSPQSGVTAECRTRRPNCEARLRSAGLRSVCLIILNRSIQLDDRCPSLAPF